jgi:hypothetical protein
MVVIGRGGTGLGWYSPQSGGAGKDWFLRRGACSAYGIRS